MSIFPMPPGVKRLHLPTHTISKPKLLARPSPERSPDMLQLSTMLVCTSAMANENNKKRALARAAAGYYRPPVSGDENSDDDDENKPQNGGEVHICGGCITRERKRAARKKVKKVEEEEMWSRDESRRVIVFNTQEIKEWQPAMAADSVLMGGRQEPKMPPGSYQVECPMRIACYCRHQNEKMGFQVIFTITDFQGRVIAQELSNSIMITDDHKTHSASSLPGQSSSVSDGATAPGPGPFFPPPRVSSDAPPLKQTPASPFAQTQALNGLPNTNVTPSPRNLSRPASPGASSGPSAKKRKAGGSIVKLPTSLAMTPRNAPPVAAPPPPADQNSPFTPSIPSFPMPDAMFSNACTGGMSARHPFTTGPPTPNSNSNENIMFATAQRSASVDDATLPHLYSAPTSAHPSRAPSPNGLRNSISSSQQAQLAQVVSHGLLSGSMAFNPSRSPVIHKIIPNEGPKSGGIEVTILGSGFSQGLEVIFGDQRATTTTFWGETSLVCLLPPSPVSGTVFVTFKQQVSPIQGFNTMPKQHPVFKYIDDDEQQLIRSALAVLGQKMTGKMEDARELARRILGDGNSWGATGGSGSASQSSGAPGFNGLSFNTATEAQLLKLLELIDLDDSAYKCRWNLRRASGQTMLHLACSLGLHRLVAGLLSRGANPDARDKGGFTPMHLAAINGHIEIVRRLVSSGADPTMRSLSGLTAADIAPAKLARSIRRIERFARSRRGGMFNSRSNSATSLRSLWEGPSSSPESSPHEYSDGLDSDQGDGEMLDGSSSFYDSSSEGEIDNVEDGHLFIGLGRRGSEGLGANSAPKSSLVRPKEIASNAIELPSTLATNTAWLAHMAAQFQQFQEAVAGPLQSITQLPNLAVMPTLQDYQVLDSLQGMRRLMSNIGGRPDSPTDQPSPPSYEDLYPQGSMDKKQASTAQATPEAEADMKRTMLYDQPSENSTPIESSSCSASQDSTPVKTTTKNAVVAPKKQLPRLLQIGRRHAITQEQRDNLQQLHSEKLVRWSKDLNLFLFWIPLLIIVMCAFLHTTFPSMFSTPLSWTYSYSLISDSDAADSAAATAGDAVQEALADMGTCAVERIFSTMH